MLRKLWNRFRGPAATTTSGSIMNQVSITFSAEDLRAAGGRRSSPQKAADVVVSLANGKPVSRRMVAENMGIKVPQAGKHLQKAYRLGLIEPANTSFQGWFPVQQQV